MNARSSHPVLYNTLYDGYLMGKPTNDPVLCSTKAQAVQGRAVAFERSGARRPLADLAPIKARLRHSTCESTPLRYYTILLILK